ncbi:purine-nucleoside phosphorylase [Bdellovibrio reynosensis]|uniref:Purine nucleoside phosphorylase n=1 Tax=Bdellovibrio reynosensis TaxID=2835041 RepID=A0ABY4C6E6_9BACT|nr:purine-nucleoside phosphorylase [Bdellovibrio reynosensis]UOF00453.1 purine-nucleoside phosphorylase [Bdellovibrio reynosensis]
MILEDLQETVSFIRTKTSAKPKIGVVLGSGLGAFVKDVEVEATIPYKEIPHFSPPTVEGHSGNLIFGKVGGQSIAILQGRNHFYEGHPMSSVVFPVRTLAMLGVETLILTNSAGGFGESMQAGDFMIIEDHINLMGTNPLMGPNIKELGPRFPDMTEAYDKRLISIMEQLLQKQGTRYHKGIYCGVSGPTYETPAEVRYLKLIGGKAVGMSTVPETIAANHLGLRVAALSCITNLAAGISNHKLSHTEVTETAKRVELEFSSFLREFIGQL